MNRTRQRRIDHPGDRLSAAQLVVRGYEGLRPGGKPARESLMRFFTPLVRLHQLRNAQERAWQSAIRNRDCSRTVRPGIEGCDSGTCR